jgi:dethiobiotin synthetase
MKGVFVTAIGTDSGKTIVSGLLTHWLRATYWKPVQTGTDTDRATISKWLGAERTLPEQYHFQLPASPHYSAEQEGEEIALSAIELPRNNKPIVVEGAGGLLVPLSKQVLTSELIEKLQLPVVLVVNFYLGSINHSLLTFEVLKSLQLPVLGLIFNGTPTPGTEEILLDRSPWPVLARVPALKTEELIHFTRTADALEHELPFNFS